MDPRAPKGQEWNDVLEVLHHVGNTITARAHYGEGHPAITQADATVEKGFARVLDATPEIILALVEGEFVVSERPMPQLRQRLHILADAMVRHEIECIVFQRGVRQEEVSTLGQLLASAPEPGGRLRDLAQQRMAHVLFRFAFARAGEGGPGEGTASAYLVPQAEQVLVSVARSLGAGAPVDVPLVLALASRIVSLARAQAVSLEQRAWSRSIADEASHAVDVAQISAVLSLHAGYTEKECIDVTAAALLHDIGHLFVPEEIRGIPEPLLDAAARPVFRNHTYAGASLLLSAGCPPLWVAAAFEHHRGVDGGGYPSLDAKTAPHELVRFVALANFHDRKRTRLHGHGADPDEVVREAFELESRFFGKGLTARLVRALGVFPPGTTVELSDREPAIVTRSHAGDPLRPQVRLLRGPRAGKVVDLREGAASEGRFARSIVRAVLPPLLVPGDAVAEQDEAPEAKPEEDVVDDPWSMVTPVRKRPTRRPPEGGPTSTDLARRELSGMSALLDDLLTVPAAALAAPPLPVRPSIPGMPAFGTSVPSPSISVTPPAEVTAPSSRPAAWSRGGAIPPVHVTVPPGAMESQRPPRPTRSQELAVADTSPPLARSPFTSAPPDAPSASETSAEDIEVLMMMGRWAEALAACDACLARGPADPVVIELRARCLEKTGAVAPPPAVPSEQPRAATHAVAPPRAPSVDVRARLGAVPALAIAESATYGLPLGPEARFVITLVDGVSSLETIADASGLPLDQALAILADLLDRGILAVD